MPTFIFTIAFLRTKSPLCETYLFNFYVGKIMEKTWSEQWSHPFSDIYE